MREREREREKLGQVYSIQTKANQSIVIPNSNHHGRTKCLPSSSSSITIPNDTILKKLTRDTSNKSLGPASVPTVKKTSVGVKTRSASRQQSFDSIPLVLEMILLSQRR